MQAVVRVALALTLFSACRTSDHARPDASNGDGAPMVDAAAGSAGLTLTWSVQPMVPGMPQAGISVDELAFLLVDADVTGDAGSVKSQPEKLHWIEGTAPPQPIEFPSAPIGLYSKVALDIDGQLVDNSWWINGHVMINGSNMPFEIYDPNSLAISLDTDTQLSPGQAATIGILIELDHVFSQVDFTKFGTEDAGATLVLAPDNDPHDYMSMFVQGLTASFVVQTSMQ